MQRINITLDVSKINKDKIVPRSYVNREGKPVTVKEYKIEAIELKEQKILKSGDDWDLKKTHFLVEAQTPKEKEAKKEAVYVGEGTQFFNRDITPVDPDEVTAF